MNSLKPKTSLQDAEKAYFDMMGEAPCFTPASISIEELDTNIQECHAMLSHAITTSDKSEIAFWRKMLQQAKMQRRELLAA